MSWGAGLLASLEGIDHQTGLHFEAYVPGMRPSPYHGFSVEFAEQRKHVPGNDVRHVGRKTVVLMSFGQRRYEVIVLLILDPATGSKRSVIIGLCPTGWFVLNILVDYPEDDG